LSTNVRAESVNPCWWEVDVDEDLHDRVSGTSTSSERQAAYESAA
jgi:hypothetical protein